MSQAVIKAFYDKLVSATGAGTFYAAVSGRIYSGQGPEDCDLPYAVFHLITNTESDTFVDEGTEINFQINVYGEKKLGLKAVMDINDKLRALLNHAAISASGWDTSKILCITAGIPTINEEDIDIRSEWRLYGTKT